MPKKNKPSTYADIIKKGSVNDSKTVTIDSVVLSPEELQEQKQFVNSLVENGQAVVAVEGQPLPSKATHIITGYESDGTPIVVRKRFSLL